MAREFECDPHGLDRMNCNYCPEFVNVGDQCSDPEVFDH